MLNWKPLQVDGFSLFLFLLHRWQNRGRTSRGSGSWVLLSPTITSRPTEGGGGGAHGSDGTQWRAARLQAHSKKNKKTTQTQALRTIHAFRVHLQLLMSKNKTKRQTPAHHFWLGAFFLRHSHGLMGYKPCLMRSLGHEWQRGGTRLCEWSASHDTHPAV